LLRLNKTGLIDINDVGGMEASGPDFIFIGFTAEGLRLLKQSKVPLVNDQEREIIRAVVRGFLDRHEATSKRALLRQFKSPITTALQRLGNQSVLHVANNTYLSETYLPRAVAFFHCGDSAALAFARRSTELVLRVLRDLFDRELETEGNDQKQFTSAEVEREARAIDSSIESEMIFTGLYLAKDFSVFSSTQPDDRGVGIVSFSLGEHVYNTPALDWDEHIRRSNVSLVYALENTGKKSMVVSYSALDPEPFTSEGDNQSRKIFLVHGHAEEPKQNVATFMRALGLDVIILHEQANQGLTIIEKFEKHSGVGFAVVLLTPDDFGGPAGRPEKMRQRARQNVILELGYFIAKLERNRVCCLYVEGVELPSDYDGVLWVPYDASGKWREQLVKELTASGIHTDARKAALREAELVAMVSRHLAGPTKQQEPS
jgi:predicted nucleotide-binding protein